MKTVNFESISIKNFLSIGNEPVVINFKTGVNCITGENKDVPDTKNAVGKSTIASAFNFVIFGNALKNLSKEQMVNNIIGKGTEVILTFTCNSPRGNNKFKVIRTIAPSSLKIYKDGKDKTHDSISSSTKYLTEVLSATPEIFRNCVLMQANNTIPFMAQGKVEKKKFIEGLFSLDLITKMFKLVKNDINVTKRDFDTESRLLDAVNTNIEVYKGKRKTQKQLIDNAAEQHRQSIADLSAKIIEITKEINELSNKDEDTADLEDQLSDAQKKHKKAKASKEKLERTKVDISTDLRIVQRTLTDLEKKGDTCPTCNRRYDTAELAMVENKKEELTEEIKKYNEQLNATQELLKKAQKISNNLESIITKLTEKISTSNFNKRLLSTQKEKLTDYIKMRDSMAAPVASDEQLKVFDELISKAEDEKVQKEQLTSSLKKNLDMYESARFILSEEGLKAYLIKKLLKVLNLRIKHYLSKMNSQYILEFNEVFEDKIINKRKVNVSYGNLSGAESKMMDLACIWSFRDILRLQGAVQYNISFYDEILDSSMDAKNSEIVCNILNDFATKDKEMIYLITHKVDMLKAINGEIITLCKEKGITTLI